MSTMPAALAQYIAVRRALGAKLREPAVRLREFVDFLKNQGAEFITTELALCWAMQPKNVQRATEDGDVIRRTFTPIKKSNC
jgi:hypothetical protein